MSVPWYEISKREFSNGELPTVKGDEKMMMEWIEEQVKEMAKAKPDGFELTLDTKYLMKRYNTENLDLLMEFNRDGITVTITDKQVLFRSGTTLRERLDKIAEYQRKRRERQE